MCLKNIVIQLHFHSILFCVFVDQVVFSDEFKKSFAKLKYPQLRREVLQKLIKLGVGWRTTMKNLNFNVIDPFQLAKVYKVRDLYLVWSTDIEKSERYVQIIRIWDLLSHQNVARTVQRLENLFSMYTDEYLDKCRRVKTEGYVLFCSASVYIQALWISFPFDAL